MKKYGLVFGVSFFLSLITLIALNSQFNIDTTLPGDIKIGNFIYFPLTSSLAIASFITIMLEAYQVFKNT